MKTNQAESRRHIEDQSRVDSVLPANISFADTNESMSISRNWLSLHPNNTEKSPVDALHPANQTIDPRIIGLADLFDLKYVVIGDTIRFDGYDGPQAFNDHRDFKDYLALWSYHSFHTLVGSKEIYDVR